MSDTLPMVDTVPHGFSPYTENPLSPPAVIFPNHGLQILSTLLNLVGISVMTWALARRSTSFNIFTTSWRELSWPKLCVILVFINSWAFIFTEGILISGAGLSLNGVTCMLGIYSCIALYASSKILVYAFLIEKVWIVWSQRGGVTPTGLRTRWNSYVWRICMLLLIPYFIILLLMILGRIAEIRQSDGVCIIGLHKFASIPLLTFDLFITFFLTFLFVWPLYIASAVISSKLRSVARRTLMSSLVALITSSVNIAVLTILHGRELGWVCLTSCAADVTVNGIVLFWVTAGSSKPKPSRPKTVAADQEYYLPTTLGGVVDPDCKSDRSGVPPSNHRFPPKPRIEDQDVSDDEDFDNEKIAPKHHHPPSAFDYLPPGQGPILPMTTPASSSSGSSLNSPKPTFPKAILQRPGSAKSPRITALQHDGVIMMRPQTAEPGGQASLRTGAKTFFRGLGDVFGMHPPPRSSDNGQTLSVQVTVTTEHNARSPRVDHDEEKAAIEDADDDVETTPKQMQ